MLSFSCGLLLYARKRAEVLQGESSQEDWVCCRERREVDDIFNLANRRLLDVLGSARLSILKSKIGLNDTTMDPPMLFGINDRWTHEEIDRVPF